MKKPGQVALMPFPQVDLVPGKPRPVLLIAPVPGPVEALVSDDYLAFVAATRLGLKARMLPDLVLELTEHGSLTAEAAEAILEVLRPRYRVGVIEHSLARLQEVKK